MGAPYIKSDFKFSQESLDWILNTFGFLKDVKLNHDLFRMTLSKKQLGRDISFNGSTAFEEIKNYLKKFGIDESYYVNEQAGPDIFCHNKTDPVLYYPHFDGNYNNSKLVKTRFNTCVIYNPIDDMHWWEDAVPGHPLVMPDRRMPVAVKGNTAKERLFYLGNPGCVAEKLYSNTCSAFVRTDCAHSFTLKNPGMRLVITVALDKTVDELREYL